VNAYQIYLASGADEPFSVWLSPRLTAWSRAQGFTRIGPDRYGVEERTQSEANRAALAALGPESLCTYLQENP